MRKHVEQKTKMLVKRRRVRFMLTNLKKKPDTPPTHKTQVYKFITQHTHKLPTHIQIHYKHHTYTDRYKQIYIYIHTPPSPHSLSQKQNKKFNGKK